MFIDVFKNNGKPYLRLVNSVKVKNAQGKKVSQKQAVLNIGPLDKYDDGKADYIGRLRKSFKAGQPLIDFIEPYCARHAPTQQYTFHYTQGEPACIGNPKLFSHILIERILGNL